MPTRQIKRRCEEIINALDIPKPFDLTEFCARLERQRGRAIQLIQITAAPGAPCGMWVAAKATDYIFHERGTSPLHRQQIVLHELGHLVLGHQGEPWETNPIGLLLPDLDPTLIESMLGRIAYTTTEEVEAETFADLVSLSLKNPSSHVPDPDVPPEMIEIIARIERSLGRTPGAPRTQDDERQRGQGDA